VHIDLSNDTPLHRLVIQIWHVRRIDRDVLFGNAVVCLCASHDDDLRPENRRVDKSVPRRKDNDTTLHSEDYLNA
jgi:hypothetical protein